MATDISKIVSSLAAFYDFSGANVVDAGCGEGLLVDYARPARRVVAIDKDGVALKRLAERLAQLELTDKFSFLEGDLLQHRPRGDVVLFGFSLHEMAEPERALAHARELALDVVVIDHAPESPWEWYAAEEHQLVAAWSAVARGSIRRQQAVEAFQVFTDYAALEAKLAPQGPESMKRIDSLRGQRPISISMPYRLALL